ncbi:MAG: SsrA-binding protein SmpB [Candidatus Egerieousia sp.]
MGEKKVNKVDIRNRRAGFDYEFLENYTAGVVLAGTEIKSIRAGKASLADSFCYFANGELYVKNMHVADYWWASYNRKDPKRDRKLLLNRKELNKLQRSVKEKGLTIVPTRLFISDNGYAKLNISLAKGKKEYDKRESIKEKDMRRAAQRGDDY